MFDKILQFTRRHALLLVVAFIIMILVALFHEIMAPFLIALVVVYLMEPFVHWMNQHTIRKRKIPRAVAVVTTYLAFFTAMTGLGFAFIPSLTAEISRATEALPKFFTRVKDEDIPRWSENIDRLLFTLSVRDKHDIRQAVSNTSHVISQAFQDAADANDANSLPQIDTSGAQPLLILGHERETFHGDRAEVPTHSHDGILVRIHKSSKSDEYYVLAGDRDLLFEADNNGSYTLRLTPGEPAQPTTANFNLEQELHRVVLDFFESGMQYAGSALVVLQYAIESVINTFVQLILVFMLAAFISIDLPKLMARIRALFEASDGSTDAFDDLLHRLGKGLGGVIRGQLTICLINGTLTGIGLWILGVDFAILLGIIAGVLSIIPIFGTIISTVPAVLLGLVQGFSTALLVLIWILIVHAIDTNFFTPKIVGSSASLHPVVIVFALLAGQSAFGVLGLVFAVPVASIAQTLLLFAIEKARRNAHSPIPLPTILPIHESTQIEIELPSPRPTPSVIIQSVKRDEATPTTPNNTPPQ